MIKVERYEMDDELFGEKTVDYSVNVTGQGTVIEVNVPEFITLKTLDNGNKCLYDINDLPTKIIENEQGNLVVFSGGEYYPVGEMEKAWNFIRNYNITDDGYIAANSYDDEGDRIKMFLVENINQVRDAYLKDLEQGRNLEKEETSVFLDRHEIGWEA